MAHLALDFKHLVSQNWSGSTSLEVHQGDGIDVIFGPEAGDNGFRAGEKEGSLEAGDSLLAKGSTGTSFAGGESHEVGTGEGANLANLDIAAAIQRFQNQPEEKNLTGKKQ